MKGGWGGPYALSLIGMLFNVHTVFVLNMDPWDNKAAQTKKDSHTCACAQPPHLPPFPAFAVLLSLLRISLCVGW